MSAAPDHAILYDADCGFCTRSLSRVLRLDRRGRLRAVAIQSEEGQALLDRGGVPEPERLQSWHLIEPDGRAVSGGAAAVPLLRLLPGGGAPAAVLAALPRSRDAVYGWVATHRDLLGRFLVLVLAVSVAGFGAGCGSTVQDDSQLTVYVSAPTSGEDARSGRALISGAEEALADAGGEAGGAPVALVALDDTDGSTWTQASLAANAREATQDSTSIAYVGELDSDATRLSVPITNEAGLLQVAPGPVAPDLLAEPGGNDVPADIQTTGERTLGTIFPDLDRADTSPTVALPFKQLGYEAMAVVLDSIDRAEDPLSRADVVAAFLATADRQSELGGTYTIAPSGAAVYGD